MSDDVITWYLDVTTFKEIEFVSASKSLKIVQLGIWRFLTDFSNFENTKLLARFKPRLLLRLKYPFIMESVNGEFRTLNNSKDNIFEFPGGQIDIRLIEKRTLEIYLNNQKVGEVRKYRSFIYTVAMISTLEHKDICCIFMSLFCYFYFFVDESGIRGIMMWEEKDGKRRRPYFLD